MESKPSKSRIAARPDEGDYRVSQKNIKTDQTKLKEVLRRGNQVAKKKRYYRGVKVPQFRNSTGLKLVFNHFLIII